jgi:hypothetical protein
MRPALRELAEAAKQKGPKDAILDALGDLSWYEPFHNLVLVGTYVPPAMIGSVHIPDKSHSEARFQGVCGLVLRIGPGAFKDEGHIKFYGVTVNEHDWIIYRPSDAVEQFLRFRGTINDGVSCRLIEDSHIKGRVDDPSRIY